MKQTSRPARAVPGTVEQKFSSMCSLSSGRQRASAAYANEEATLMSSEAAAGPRFPAATSSERREAPVVERHRVGGMGCAWSCWTAGRTDRRARGRRRAIVIQPLPHWLHTEPFVCRSQWGGAWPQKNSLVQALPCFMNKLDSPYGIINLLYPDGLRGDYRALEQISIPRSTQILGFNKNIL